MGRRVSEVRPVSYVVFCPDCGEDFRLYVSEDREEIRAGCNCGSDPLEEWAEGYGQALDDNDVAVY